jgi:DNA-binding transcriptional ArsR family regulator
VVDLSFLTKKDIEILDEKAGFTDEQRVILEHLRKNDLSDEGIMLELRLSRNKYYKIKENLIQKIIRTAVQS